MPLDLTNEYDYWENGITGTATKNTTTDFDFKIESTSICLNGGQIIYQNANWGDYVTAQVVDKDGVYAPAGTVLNEYIIKRYLLPANGKEMVCLEYGSIVPINAYLRLKYTSTSATTDVDVAINYYLHYRR